jgi:hypothetical protein
MGEYPKPQLQIKRVTSVEMCKRFNEGGFWERVKSGLLTEHVLESGVSSLLVHEPGPILSQSVSYRDSDGFEVARIHQFLRSDGSVAASGRPDPKRLIQDGIMYRLEKKRKT